MPEPEGRRTLLVALAHPDDEVSVAGTMLAQRERGDRVVLVWLTRGEMTEAFGALPTDEVATRREEHGARAAEMLGVEHRFLGFEDTRLQHTPDAVHRVARTIADVRPDGVVTWGDAWVRGARHPDHQACGAIVRDAITLARIAKVVEPVEPHRSWCPVFTLRSEPSPLEPVAVDVEGRLDAIFELAAFYRERVGFGDRAWLERRLRTGGKPFGLDYAEVFDAWESEGGVREALLPADPGARNLHPSRGD